MCDFESNASNIIFNVDGSKARVEFVSSKEDVFYIVKTDILNKKLNNTFLFCSINKVVNFLSTHQQFKNKVFAIDMNNENSNFKIQEINNFSIFFGINNKKKGVMFNLDSDLVINECEDIEESYLDKNNTYLVV